MGRCTLLVHGGGGVSCTVIFLPFGSASFRTSAVQLTWHMVRAATFQSVGFLGFCLDDLLRNVLNFWDGIYDVAERSSGKRVEPNSKEVTACTFCRFTSLVSASFSELCFSDQSYINVLLPNTGL